MIDNRKIKIKIADGYLVATMPNGQAIPCQHDLKIENNVPMKSEVKVTITTFIPFENIDLTT